MILDFYKEKEKDLTEIEKDILEIIQENQIENYANIIERDERLDVFQALSSIRRNIVNWYPFKPNSNVLEINANFGEITEELCQKVKKVTSIEQSKLKAEAIEKRLECASNLQVIVGTIEDITLPEKFDYILINGVEEQEILLEEYLQYAKKYIKEDGIILFTIDNKLGLQTYHVNFNKKENKRYISKNKIEEILQKLELHNIKFYYPLPNYKTPNIIFTDKHLPNSESITRDLTLYDKNDILVLDERERYKEIIQENAELFKVFANSYLVEIAKQDNNIEFVSFGNSRKEKYRMKTIIEEDVVYKQNVSDVGKEHLERIKNNIDILKNSDIDTLDRYEENKVCSKLIRQEKTFEKILIEKWTSGKTDEFNNLIETFIDEITKKLSKSEKSYEKTVFEKYQIHVEKEVNDKLHYVKYGLYDLIFQNCFYIENKFYFYDQEWIEENIPLEFIIYRAIYYMSKNLPLETDMTELYKRFQIFEYVPLFEQLENTLQEEVKDNYIWMVMHAMHHTTVRNVYDTQIHYRNLKAMTENQLIQTKAELEKQQQENECIKNSKSWKITKPLRKIRALVNKEEKFPN